MEKKLDLILEKLEGLTKEFVNLKQDVGGLKQDVGDLKQGVGGLKQDVGGLKQDVIDLKQDVGGLKQDVIDLKQDVGGLKQDVKEIKTQESEHTQLLNALCHSTEVSKAQHDSLSMDLSKLTGEVVGLRKDLSTIEVVTASNYSDLAKIKAVK